MIVCRFVAVRQERVLRLLWDLCAPVVPRPCGAGSRQCRQQRECHERVRQPAIAFFQIF